jgi:hypothetical protein
LPGCSIKLKNLRSHRQSRLDDRFSDLPGWDIGLRLFRYHFHPSGDLPTILDLKATATRCTKDPPAATNNQAAANGQGAVDRACNLGVFNLDFALEDAAGCN